VLSRGSIRVRITVKSDLALRVVLTSLATTLCSSVECCIPDFVVLLAAGAGTIWNEDAAPFHATAFVLSPVTVLLPSFLVQFVRFFVILWTRINNVDCLSGMPTANLFHSEERAVWSVRPILVHSLLVSPLLIQMNV
jgi:hypothetical protein